MDNEQTKTPPNRASPLPSSSTPVRPEGRTLDEYGSEVEYKNRTTMMKNLSEEMSPFFIGPMPPQKFLDTFLPPSKPSCGTPRTLEPGLFSPLVGATLETGLCKTFVCFRTLLIPEINPYSSRLKSLHRLSQG